MVRLGFLVAGFKGINFLKGIHRDCQVTFVSSYDDAKSLDTSMDEIVSLCREHEYTFVEHTALGPEVFDKADIIFVVGWQYIIDNADDRFIIFHDALLPRYRGFAPTVTALIRGDRNIGVTALKPTALADRGPVYAQQGTEIAYPIKIKDAFLKLVDCYIGTAKSVIRRAEKGTLVAAPQDEPRATYSIWRDRMDYYIDWSWPSEKISRFVDALGWPYLGARALYAAAEIIIDDVEIIADLKFEDRHPGKIWILEDGIPSVVCGEGMVRIVSARNEDGSRVEFKRLRERLSRP